MPEHKRVVVANTTPIIALALFGQLNLLGQLYGEVLIPPAVEDEILRGGASGVGAAKQSPMPTLRNCFAKAARTESAKQGYWLNYAKTD